MRFLKITGFVFTYSLLAVSAFAEDVNIEVTGIDINKKGQLIVLIFGEDGFPIKHEKALYEHNKPATRNVMNFQFQGINRDEIAIKILHDQDTNNKLTKNWTGIFPNEGLGFSNGQKINFGPPNYVDSKVPVVSNYSIKVIYP